MIDVGSVFQKKWFIWIIVEFYTLLFQLDVINQYLMKALLPKSISNALEGLKCNEQRRQQNYILNYSSMQIFQI